MYRNRAAFSDWLGLIGAGVLVMFVIPIVGYIFWLGIPRFIEEWF